MYALEHLVMHLFSILIDIYVHIVALFLHYSPDHWSYYVNYLNCQIKRHSTGETNNAGHSPIIEAKDFIRHNKAVEEAKKQGKVWAPFLGELEPCEAKLEDIVELCRLVVKCTIECCTIYTRTHTYVYIGYVHCHLFYSNHSWIVTTYT